MKPHPVANPEWQHVADQDMEDTRRAHEPHKPRGVLATLPKGQPVEVECHEFAFRLRSARSVATNLSYALSAALEAAPTGPLLHRTSARIDLVRELMDDLAALAEEALSYTLTPDPEDQA